MAVVPRARMKWHSGGRGAAWFEAKSRRRKRRRMSEDGDPVRSEEDSTDGYRYDLQRFSV